MTDLRTDGLGPSPDPDSAGSRLLTEQDAERRAFEAWCEVADYTPNDPEAPHTEAFYGGYRAALVARDADRDEWEASARAWEASAIERLDRAEEAERDRDRLTENIQAANARSRQLAAMLVARDAELETARDQAEAWELAWKRQSNLHLEACRDVALQRERAERAERAGAELAEVRVYAHGFKDAVAELEADLDRVKAIALHRLQLLDKRDAELAAAQRREVAARDHMVHMLKEAGVSADWRYWQARTETAEAEVTRLRAALAEAGVVLEVLAGQIADKPYRELSRDFQQTIMAATLTTREALSREASDTRTLASSGGEQA